MEATIPLVEEVVSEITRALNKDMTNPSYTRVVASACLRAILTVGFSSFLFNILSSSSFDDSFIFSFKKAVIFL